ncbi:hypothetical protein BTI_3900 [Burkholderia thailandensis MSMB121]|uniref:putative baseplate assembly protein n=1 Tax=Burkholderia humptydooensis TaxID=430531 RepID=UPI0003280014|nr:putative baseplate assembly protein [Burkholderia humptydooensis]AGK50111.1 hypothetical protein BTI_3900 [Burkholderia thailandensis MSMB121]ATF32496.1 putative baseplate assembly protein [Burkholderia thailandensis]KST70590.1 phage tail protein [Burkholderia humptydooensis]
MNPLPLPEPKPRASPQPPGSECCGCCAGTAADTPQGLANRDGLSAIAYRIGDHAQFRDSLHAALSQAALPALHALRTRDDDDFTIGLIDAFACAADVLTFYQERIANESYLRTATERVSLQEMSKLIGYRLRPGVAAETWLAFALDTPPAPPPTLAPEPGSFVTGVPSRVTLDAGLKVQSVPGPNETPQTFETLEAVDARPEWNAMRPWMARPRRPRRGDTIAYLAGVRNDLRPGDAVLFVGDEFDRDPASRHWDFRILDDVALDADHDRTRIGWTHGLGEMPAHARLYALRKRAAVFGHNAPMWRSMSGDFRTGYLGGRKDRGEWPNFVLSPAGDGSVDLDAVAAQAVPGRTGRYAVLALGDYHRAAPSTGAAAGSGGWRVTAGAARDILRAGGGGLAGAGAIDPAAAAATGARFSRTGARARGFVELFAIDAADDVSRAEFALSGKVTRLALRGANYARFKWHVRDTAVFVQSEPLVPADHPVTGDVGGARVPVAASADGLLPGRRLVVLGTRVRDGAKVVVHATLVAAHRIDGARCILEIAPPLADALARDSVVVHGNVALASHGETVAQVLGAGDASQAFQRFELKQAPLTYRAAANEIGAAAALAVRIGDVAWHERATLFGAGAAERAYALNTDEQGRTFVAFGDGLRGARLPSGVNNVRASYRKGLGAAGNVRADTLTQLMSRPLGVRSVGNPRAAEGGTDPESADAARRNMPLATRTLGRAVSLVDYEDYARAFSGVAKAQARVLPLPHGATIAITIAGPGGAALSPSSTVWRHLLAALVASGDPHVSVRLLGAALVTFRLGLAIKRDPDYDAPQVLAAVEAALRAACSFDSRELAQPVQLSGLIAVAQRVPGVVAVDVTRLYRGAAPAKQTRLLAATARVQDGIALPAELLTLDPAPFDQLEVMP